MKTVIPLNEFVDSDIALTASFDSNEITLDDVLALVDLSKGIIEAAQYEIARRTDLKLMWLCVVWSINPNSLPRLEPITCRK